MPVLEANKDDKETSERKDEGHQEHHTENNLCPNCPPEIENEDVDESELNPYERALRDNENHKKRFVEELKREAEERKK